MAWTEAYHVLATVMIDALKTAAPPVQPSPFGRIVGVQP